MRDTNLRHVDLPSTLEVVWPNVFRECSRLDSLVFPDNMRMLGGGAMMDCPSLTYVHLPENMVEIEWGLFADIIEACTAIAPVADASPVSITVRNGRIIVEGAPGDTVRIYDMMGREVPNKAVPTGVYLVKVGTRPAQKVVVLK